MKKKPISSLKRDVWGLFSKYIRLRDCLKTTGCTSFGLCVTCDKRLHYNLLQAGHFIPGRHNANLFSERGVHAQCRFCNGCKGGNPLEYRRRIIEMYGPGADEELEREAREVKRFTRQDLEDLAASLREKIRELEA